MPKGGHTDPSDSKHEQKLQAVLLADSFTSTFRPITLDRSQPKVLCPLNNVTMLDYSIEFLAGAGVEELFVFCVHGAETVEEYVQNSTWTSSIRVTCVKDSNCTNAGDALRELDKRNLVQSDPFILMSGDVVTNVDIVPALAAHKARHKKDNSAIMTVLLKRVGGWDVTESAGEDEVVRVSPLRSLSEDLVVGIDPHDQNRVLLFDSDPSKSSLPLPTSFFSSHREIDVRTDMLDTGIDICSPDVLARFSDEFDYRDIRRQFVANSCAEEEEGLQNRIYAHILGPSEYAARIHDPRTYGAVSADLLRRWCYPVVPDNLPSGYEKRFRYVLQRRFMYREAKDGRTKIGRSSKMIGPGMVGSRCRIGESCIIKRTVIGNGCVINSNAKLQDSHLWQNVTIEEGATVIQSILCDGCTVKKGAVIGKGCIIGKGCVIGEGVVLPDFTRVTLCSDDDNEDDNFGDFGDDSDGSGFSSNDESLSEEDSGEDVESIVGQSNEGGAGAANASGVDTDHVAVGKDGIGRVWLPAALDDGEDSDYEDLANDQKGDPAGELVKSQSIGYDATHLFLQRLGIQEEEDDMFSDDEHTGMGGDGGEFDDNISFVVSGSSNMMSSNLNDGLMIAGRQRGVDVIKELKGLCLEHETSSPIENLAIELNSFKFSQNASYSDCVAGATQAILERIDIKSDTTPTELLAVLKEELNHWVPLFHKFCRGLNEEKVVVMTVEEAAIGGDVIGEMLSRAPSFRLILQILHQEEVVSEEAIIAWAESRREEDPASAIGKLFLQQPTQDFLEWLQEESESGSGSSDDDSSDEE